MALGVEHVFGIPGDYILTLYKMIEESPIKLVNMTREDNAGFAADAYAQDSRAGLHLRDLLRGRAFDVQQHRRGLCREVAGDRPRGFAGGVGAGAATRCCTTRSRGSRPSSRCSRRSPGRRRSWTGRRRRSARSTGCSRRPFATSGRCISRCRETRCRRGRSAPHRAPEGLPPSRPGRAPRGDRRGRGAATAARRPVILADVEIHRFGLQDELLTLAESTGMPIATTILGKSVISEATRSSPAFMKGRWAGPR